MDKNLEAVLAQIKKQFGDASIYVPGDTTPMDIEVISTGNLLVDEAIVAGGFPRGRIVEIYGPASSFKTTLALSSIASAHRLSKSMCGFIDVEHALDLKYARKLGVDTDRLLISQPSSGEEALRICETLIRSNSLDIVVVDSVAALTSRAEIEGEIGDAMVGAQARLMGQALKKLLPIIHSAKTVCIFINQLREKVGLVYGNPNITPGGRALPFYASVRLEMLKSQYIKEGTEVVGATGRVKVVKNKIGPPCNEAEFEVYYDEGMSLESSLLDLAIKRSILTKKGSYVYFGDIKLGQGRKAAVGHLKSNKGLFEDIMKLTLETQGETI